MNEQEYLSQLVANSEEVSRVLTSLIDKYSQFDCAGHPLEDIPYYDPSRFQWMKRRPNFDEVFGDEPNYILVDFAKWIGKDLPGSFFEARIVYVTTPSNAVELCNHRWREIAINILAVPLESSLWFHTKSVHWYNRRNSGSPPYKTYYKCAGNTTFHFDDYDCGELMLAGETIYREKLFPRLSN
ncbi:MAG: hypothetical protein WBM44_20785 [Waterburya sp.]